MIRPRWIQIAALALFALLLGGCINIQQEYWLYENGSAKVSMDIGMSQALLSMGAASGSDTTTNPFETLKTKFNASNPNIKNVQVREYTDKDLQHFAVTFEVPDFEKFLANETSQDSEFNITLTHSPDSSVLFKQVTQLNAGSETSGLDLGSMGEVFKDMYWTVTVHVPQVMSTNGQKMDNSTVQWKIPMADVFTGKAPSELTMVYQPKGSIGGGIFGGSGNSNIVIWLVGAIVLLVIAGGAAYYFLVYRKRPAAVPAAYSAAPAMGSVPQQWNAQPPQTDLSQQWGPPPQQPDFPQQWDAQPPQAGLPPQWNAQPPQPDVPPQWSAPPPQADIAPEWNAPPQQPSQPPPVQYDQTPPASPPPPAEPPQPPDYPAYTQYTQAPQVPPGPTQASDYYPTYPPQPPPASPPPAEPSPGQTDQN